MVKNIMVISVLLCLAGIAVFNFIQQEKESEEASSEMNTSAEGGAIAPVESAGLEPGDKAPAFNLETLNGDKLQLADLQGKKVILNFWATWCPPCKEEMPEMQDIHEKYGDEVEVVAVNMTSTEASGIEDVQTFNEEYAYTYTMPLDEDGNISKAYKVFNVPTTYFINTDGTISLPRKSGPMTYEFMEESISQME
ncbi:TlpA family protein disulfide reductase [Oceanobacillus kapialis]|uniref:TlpA family protein disulfide reductase n=1 Tax=Oceanobacillus kapialis TaxID=481353 RepID=UPI00384FB4EE